MVDESKRLIVVDDEGNEITMEILFTFDNNNKKYVVYFNPAEEAEEVNLFASIYDEEGNLYPIESDEEWEFVSEVIDAFMQDEE